MKYTNSHEWVKLESEQTACVGITFYAQKELGTIVYVQLPLLGKQVRADQEVAVLESTKAAIDIYSPVSGIITEVNQQLELNPGWINEFPENKGWLYKVQLVNKEELDHLIDEESYQNLVK